MTSEQPASSCKGRKRQPHWYLITWFYCPVCGRTNEYRERQYSPRPERWENRHIERDVYDWCNE